jgi:hypothetical protein
VLAEAQHEALAASDRITLHFAHQLRNVSFVTLAGGERQLRHHNSPAACGLDE